MSWHGGVSLEKSRAGVDPWQIFHADRLLYHPVLMKRTQKTSNVRIALFSRTTALAAAIAPWNKTCNVDVCCARESVRTVELAINQPRWSVTGLPPKAHTTLKALWIDARAGMVRLVDKRSRWATYASSITQSSISQSPVHTGPVIVAEPAGNGSGDADQKKSGPLQARRGRHSDPREWPWT
ncbi:MAG TPA: hypothetical protein VL860_07570 [Planctomycetota bacterium]|nr:hypothetical protein [Planctomycetota bacterium]